MEIALHIGAHATEGERLLKSLLRDAGRLARSGVTVPGPARYRQMLREAVVARTRGEGAANAREALLEAILDGTEPRRVVLSSPAFMAHPATVMEGGFLRGAGARLRAAADLLAPDRVEAFLTIRNPATWLPAAHRLVEGRSFAQFAGGADPRRLRWSDVVARLRAGAPDVPLTVWCNEDAVLLWGEAMARLAGLPPTEALGGRFDLMAAIAAPEGMERFATYMAEHPNQSQAQERRVLGAFLDKFALPDRIEEEVDVPGWDAALVEEATLAYEADVAAIAAIPGVTLLAP